MNTKSKLNQRIGIVIAGLFLCSCTPVSTVESKVGVTAPTAAPKVAQSPSLPESVPTPSVVRIEMSQHEKKLLEGARQTLGDIYDDAYYAGGPPPEGRGACTDVVHRALLNIGIDLQEEVEKDIAERSRLYPNLGDRNINYRRCPNIIVWFERFAEAQPLDSDWRPGDIVFWSLMNDGVADHTGVVSDRPGYVVHNFPPHSRENAQLNTWKIVGHYRLVSRD